MRESLISNTVLRDNVRANRLIPLTPLVRSAIDTWAFQRLRSIRQMGLSSYVFPSAEHSRFVHSVGVYGTARETFHSLAQRAKTGFPFPGMRFDEETEKEFCLAAMCHDLGHTAFSHVLEGNLLPRPFESHEECTLAILSNDNELRNAIADDVDLDALILMIRGQHPNRALAQLVSGVFDLDRCDYLIRDSKNAGVQYGLFDFSWLLHSLAIATNSVGQPILALDGPRGLEALRQFLAARRHMYKQVYYQPAIRASQLLLKAIFERITDTGINSTLLPRCPSGLRHLLQGEAVTLDDFLFTTDIEVIYLTRLLATESGDETLRAMCADFNRRRYPKAVLDSAKSYTPLADELGVSIDPPEASEDTTQLLPLGFKEEIDLIGECKELVAARLRSEDQPEDLARYLVRSETITFRASAYSDVRLTFKGREVPLEEIAAGDPSERPFPELTESFRLYRLYAPAKYRDELASHLATYRGRSQWIR